MVIESARKWKRRAVASMSLVAVSQDDEFEDSFAVTDASVSLADAPEHPPAIDEHFWEAVDAEDRARKNQRPASKFDPSSAEQWTQTRYAQVLAGCSAW